MKVYYKIILIMVILFLLGIIITKISIDHTFNKVEKNKIPSVIVYNNILKNTKQV